MERRKMLDLVIGTLAVALVCATILAAFYYAPLEPLDVSTVKYNESDYTDGDIRVKGVVQSLSGTDFSLRDVTSNDTLDVSYTGSDDLASRIANGDTVYVLGEYEPGEGLTVREVEIADDPGEPAGWTSPYSAKIFYLHVPAAWTSFLAFGIVLVGSVVYLWRGDQKWDIWALSSAEVGLVFCTVAVISGALWARAEWGYYWNWSDTKLFSTFVLWLVFIAYVAIRSGAVRHESIPRVAAIFGILGFAAVPISFVSSRIWTSIHPNVIATSQGHLSPEAGTVLLLGVLAFTSVYATLFSMRTAIERSAVEIQNLKEKLEAGE
ncbi:MAG: cytochrome c biogenesis protein [Thermoplasmata archaeon]